MHLVRYLLIYRKLSIRLSELLIAKLEAYSFYKGSLR